MLEHHPTIGQLSTNWAILTQVHWVYTKAPDRAEGPEYKPILTMISRQRRPIGLVHVRPIGMKPNTATYCSPRKPIEPETGPVTVPLDQPNTCLIPSITLGPRSVQSSPYSLTPWLPQAHWASTLVTLATAQFIPRSTGLER